MKLFEAKNAASITLPTEAIFNTHLLTMLSVACGMAGVCATAIGLIGIAKRKSEIETLVHDLFAVGSLLFLVVGGLSFHGLRTTIGAKWEKLVLAVDVAFSLDSASSLSPRYC